tara:strand:+ start:1315 stop:2049 length:735 start_codon:yes stop_codon:yes gene_type:complete
MYIDIIIPCKDPNRELISTIKSLLKAKVIKNILVIDDFSEKGNDIFQQASKFEKVIFKTNIFQKGISGALNSGIHFSENELIGRIDSGDICLKIERFDDIIKIFKKYQNVDLICSGLIADENKIIIPKVYYLKDTITPFSRIPHPTWVLKKSKVKYKYRNECIRFEDYAFLLDNKFNIHILKQNDIKYENNSRLNRIKETKISFYKTIYFIKKSHNKFLAICLGLVYLFLRIIRLLISSKKIFL